MTDTTTQQSNSGSPTQEPDVDAEARSRHYRKVALIQFLPLCFLCFAVGWSDGATGPLIPRLRQHYNVNYTVVSLIFILNTVGCIIGAVSNVYLTHKLGMGKVVALGALMQTISFVIQSPGPPFPAFVISYVFAGLGLAWQDAQANGFVASLKDSSAATKMGIIHAVYGVGALVSPVSSTYFSRQPKWHFHFLVSTAVGVLNIMLLVGVFRLKTQEAVLEKAGVKTIKESGTADNHYKQILRLKSVYLLALYLMLYVGVEVTLGNWSVTYLIEERGGGPNSGYISTGFFGGLTLGRVVLLPVNKWIGEARAVYIYLLLSIGLQLVVWHAPSLIGGAICICLVGFFIGPLYPIAMNYAGRIIPPWLLTGSIGLMTGMGASGAAIVPFVTGAIAQKAGIGSLQPILVAGLAVLMVLWFIIERTSTPQDTWVAPEPENVSQDEKPRPSDEEKL